MHIAKFQTTSDLNNFSDVVAWADKAIDGWDDPEIPSGQIHLMLEELVTNVMNHGYGPDGDDGRIWITLAATKAPHTGEPSVMLRVEDAASAFDPFAGVNPADVDASIDDREIGGLGVFLVQEMADHITYQRRDGKNCVEVWLGDPRPVLRDQSKPSQPKRRYIARNLALRFAVSFFIVFVLALAVAGALNFFKFERAFTDTASRQFDSTLQEAKLAVESSLGAGLTLASNFATQVVIDKQVEQQDGAFHLLVTDSMGRPLFLANKDEPLAELPPDLPTSARDMDGAVFRFGSSSGLGAAVPIDQAGRSVGYMILTFVPTDALTEMDRLRSVLFNVVAAITVVFAPIIALISYLSFAPIDKRHVAQTRQLEGRAVTGTSDIAHHLQKVDDSLARLEAPVVHKGGKAPVSAAGMPA